MNTKIQQSQLQIYARTALIFLFVTALLGAFLRMQFAYPIPNVNYRFFVHGHSHVAFLGWAFNGLFFLITRFFFNDYIKRFLRLFVFMQICMVGMLISFPIQGYGAVSIIFSTGHIIFSVGWIYKVVRLLSGKRYSGKGLLLMALAYLALSSLGPFFLGVCIIKGLTDTQWYKLSIYYYLHFQYNGWFIMAIIAIIVQYLQESGKGMSVKVIQWVFWTVGATTIPSFILSALWMGPDKWLFWASFIIHLVRLCGLLYLLIELSRKKIFSEASGFFKVALVVALSSLVIKSILEVAASTPVLSEMVFNNQNLIIAYLHLVFIGFVTMFLLSFFNLIGFLSPGWFQYLGLALFLSGFICSEVLLVYPGTAFFINLPPLDNYFYLLFLSSLLFPLAVPCFFVKNSKYTKTIKGERSFKKI